MPFARLSLAGRLPDAAVQTALQQDITALLHDLLGKAAALTVVAIVHLPAGAFAAGGQPQAAGVALEVWISAGSNTPAQKAAFIAAADARLRERLGAPDGPLYVLIHEMPIADWGYDGQPQAARRAPAPLALLRRLRDFAAPGTLAEGATALLLIDFQREYRDGSLPLPDVNAALWQAQRLRRAARQRGWPVIHVRQLAASPQAPLFAPGAAGSEFLPELLPAADELCVDKRLPSAFAGTGLAEILAGQGIGRLVMAGLMTHNCVDATARDAFHRGFRVGIASDACATRDLPDAAGVVPAQQVQRAVLAGLADRIAEVGDVAALLQAAG